MSTPMMKGELRSLLAEIAPDKRWPKSAKLQDMVDFTVRSIDSARQSAKERRALDLALVHYRSERR